jgi:cytochrome c oxidase subunit II
LCIGGYDMYRFRLFVVLVILVLFVTGCGQEQKNTVVIDKQTPSVGEIVTFMDTGDEVCTDLDGRPIIRKYATTWCPHCQWIKGTYTSVVEEYVAAGKIRAYLWELDALDGAGDDALTVEVDSLPESEKSLFVKYNPHGSIPTFVFGCKYIRIGNGYEQEGNLAAEEVEFRNVIDSLLQEVGVEIDEEESQNGVVKEELEVKTFEVEMKQFEFVPSTIEVSKGDMVRLTVTSTDVKHGLKIPAFDVNVKVEQGDTDVVEFVADTAGEFEFSCSVLCGSGHGSMKGTLIVTE